MPLFRITVPSAYARLVGGTTVVVDAGSALDARQAVVRAGVPFAVTGQVQQTDQQGATGLPVLPSGTQSTQRTGSGLVPQGIEAPTSINPVFDATQGKGLSGAPGSVGEGETAAPTGQASRRILPSGRDIGEEAGQTPARIPTGPRTFDDFSIAIRQAMNTANSRQEAEQALSQIIGQARSLGIGETDIFALVNQGNQLAASRFPGGDGPGGGGPGGGEGPEGPEGPGGGGGFTGTPVGGGDLQRFLDMLGPEAVREVLGPNGEFVGYELNPAIEAALGLRELELGIGQSEAERQAAIERARIQFNPFGRDAQQDAELQLALERGGLDLENFLAQREADRQAELARTQAQFNPFDLGGDQFIGLQESVARGGLTPEQRIQEILAAQQSQNLQSQLNFIGNPSAVGFAVSQGFNPLGQGTGADFSAQLGGTSQANQISPLGNSSFVPFQQRRTPTLNTLRDDSEEELQMLQGSAAASGFTPSALAQKVRSVTPGGRSTMSGRL